MERKFEKYIDDILIRINSDQETKEKIRQSLTEHIDVLVEKHGSLAYKHLQSVEKVAQEFTENLNLDNRKEDILYSDRYPCWVKRRFYRKISRKKIFNLPLYHITDGYNPETGKFEVAKGILAVGPVALGIFSWGGVAIGIFAFGGFSLALLLALGGVAISSVGAVGGMAIGGLIAVGGLAISKGLSLGGSAIGHIAIGGKVRGKYVYNTNTGEGNAVDWFRLYLPYFAKYFSK